MVLLLQLLAPLSLLLLASLVSLGWQFSLVSRTRFASFRKSVGFTRLLTSLISQFSHVWSIPTSQDILVTILMLMMIRESVKILSAALKLLSDSQACQTNKSDHERSFFISSSTHHHHHKSERKTLG